VKKRLTIALAAAALAATGTSLAAAGYYYQGQRTQVTAADALPAYEILNNVRSLGFRPTTQALRRGPYYVLHAIDPRGAEVRVVADAQLGDIVSIAPLVAPRYNGGPRIIHVPQPGERDDGASKTYEDDENSAVDDDVEAPPPRHAPVRRPAQRMQAPPARASTEPPPARPRPEQKPAGPPRAVLSAPPPAAAPTLTPIYPTPKFEPRLEPAEKFAPADDRSQNMPPPPGYTPPAAAGDQDFAAAPK
jgi:hypothetical protein